MNRIEIQTSDQVSIIAHHFQPTVPGKKVILINPATGIKQTFYFKYAEYLSECGFEAITFDFRGIGMSKHGRLRGFDAFMVDVANRNGNYYTSIDKKILMMSFSDDKMSPKKAVDELAERAFTNADVERLHIDVKKSEPVGHLRFFKEQIKDDLWAVPVKWINQLHL